MFLLIPRSSILTMTFIAHGFHVKIQAESRSQTEFRNYVNLQLVEETFSVIWV